MIKLLALTALLTGALLAGCSGGETNDATEVATEGGTVRTSGTGEDATPTIEGTEGTTATAATGETATSASGLVFARPYPGSRVVSSVTSPTDDGGLITFQTDAPVDTVIAYYRERANEAGFNSLAEITMGEDRHFGAEAASGGAFNVVVTPQGDQSIVTVTWEGVTG